MNVNRSRTTAVIATALSIAVLVLATVPATASESASKRRSVLKPPSRTISVQEQSIAERTFNNQIARQSRALAVPTAESSGSPAEPQGRPLSVQPALPQGQHLQSPRAAQAAAAAASEGFWSGAYSQNPNRQIGRLFFDRPDGEGGWETVHCSATAINSENKSLVLTAGHCVYNTDPDKNGIIDGNGYWYRNLRFCPGYENGCKLGVWYARQISTTNSWFNGDANRRYTFADDIAIVLVNPNAQGYLVNVVWGQGITFNQTSIVHRNAFGYPAADQVRFPGHDPRFVGEDMYACSGSNAVASGNLRISCTMTGGASGGPWLSWVNAAWVGYVNSVNSHKPAGLGFMDAPYFGTAESNLFQYWRNR